MGRIFALAFWTRKSLSSGHLRIILGTEGKGDLGVRPRGSRESTSQSEQDRADDGLRISGGYQLVSERAVRKP